MRCSTVLKAVNAAVYNDWSSWLVERKFPGATLCITTELLFVESPVMGEGLIREVAFISSQPKVWYIRYDRHQVILTTFKEDWGNMTLKEPGRQKLGRFRVSVRSTERYILSLVFTSRFSVEGTSVSALAVLYYRRYSTISGTPLSAVLDHQQPWRKRIRLTAT